MKKFIISIVTFFTAILFSSCNENEKASTSEQSSKVMVILNDRSASINNDATDIANQKRWLTKYLNDSLQAQSDIIIMNINSNSASAVNHQNILWDFRNTTPDGGEGSISDTDKMLKESAKVISDRKQMKAIKKQILEKLYADEIGNRSQHTQIIELVPELDKLTKAYNEISIVFISDMFQESSVRNFRFTPILSREQAEEMAEEDFKKLSKQYSLPDDVLSRVHEIQVLVPSKTDAAKLVTTPYYFSKFYALFGFKNTIKWASI